MKNLAHKLMVVAAAMAAVAGTVSAQSMKAEVPFSFKVSGTVMPAGTYMVTAAHHTSTPLPCRLPGWNGLPGPRGVHRVDGLGQERVLKKRSRHFV